MRTLVAIFIDKIMIGLVLFAIATAFDWPRVALMALGGIVVDVVLTVLWHPMWSTLLLEKTRRRFTR